MSILALHEYMSAQFLFCRWYLQSWQLSKVSTRGGGSWHVENAEFVVSKNCMCVTIGACGADPVIFFGLLNWSVALDLEVSGRCVIQWHYFLITDVRDSNSNSHETFLSSDESSQELLLDLVLSWSHLQRQVLSMTDMWSARRLRQNCQTRS